MFQTLIAVVVLSSASPVPEAETVPSAEAGRTWRISLESDPLTFALGGYSGLVNVVAPGAPQWRFGAGAFGIGRAPQAMIDLNEANRGFGMSVPWALAVNALYFFAPERGGFFVGSLAMLDNQRLTHADFPGVTSQVSHLALAVIGGYQWFPFQQLGLYLMPWVGAAGALTVRGEPVVGDRRFASPAISPALAVHVGYEFTL